MSPLREIFVDQDRTSEANVLRPDASTSFLPVAPLKTALLISSVLGIAALALLAHHLAWWPFRQRPARAFSAAARKSLPAQRSRRHRSLRQGADIDPPGDRSTAGRRIFPDDLGQFIARHRQHSASEAGLEAFFQASRALYFGGNMEDGVSRFPPERVRALANDLAAQGKAAA